MSDNTVLNLDELELTQNEIAIVHKGKKHHMRTLTVEMFIAQQKRAKKHEEAVAKGEINQGEDGDVTDMVALIRDAVLEFFPTLPVNELETTKLFSIFAWLNDMSSKLNQDGASDAGVETEEDEGNVAKAE